MVNVGQYKKGKRVGEWMTSCEGEIFLIGFRSIREIKNQSRESFIFYIKK